MESQETDVLAQQPGNYRIRERSAQGLFSVRGLGQRTHVDQMYLNGLSTVVPFWISNDSGRQLDVVVDVTSGGAGSIWVQQQNANWSAVSAQQRASYVSCEPADGTGELRVVCNPAAQREFSEVLNLMHDGQQMVLTLAADQTAEAVLVLCAADDAAAAVGAAAAASESARADEGARTHGFVECSGLVSVRAAGDGFEAHVRGSFCQSVLEMEPATSRVYLDDCVVGRVYER
ncbi:hypothetical protein LPJ66_011053, partial [Kickxella alabastrina]